MLKSMNTHGIRRSLARGAHWRLSLTALLIALMLATGVNAPASAQAAAPSAPKAPGSPDWVTPPYNPWLYYGGGHAGSVYIGAVPPNSGSKPVLVFVVGLHGQAHDWWQDTAFYGHNDMYEYAYNYGYRTAFVNLWDSNGLYWGGTMWDNGQMLANELAIITNYFGVSSVNVVAHSKGGVDTQAAIAYYGAGPRVQRLLTLDSPHWGSQVADLGYIGPLWWEGVLLGQLDNATYVMTTGYMNYFRSLTDGRLENNQTRWYTTGGTDWGTNALWWSGLYLSAWGSNDGLVTVNNTHLPWEYSTQVRVSYVNHDNVRTGRASMGLIDQYLSTFWRNGMGPEKAETPVSAPTPEDSANPTSHVASSSIVRGGPLASDGTASTDQITVETGATSLAIDLTSNVAGLDLTWTAPSGKQYTAQGTLGGGELFSNAYHYVVKVDAPQAGTWRLSVRNTTGQTAAYGMVANVTSPVTVALDRDPALVFAAGGKLPVRLTASDATGRAISNLQVTGVLRQNDGAAHSFTVPAGHDEAQAALDLPNAAGVANLAFTVTGQLSDGSAFERTVVTSVAVVDKDGKMPLPTSIKTDASTQP
jgi:hypothetical protein